MNDIYAYRYARLIQNKISVYRYTNLNDLSINNTPQSKYRYIFRYTTIISNIYPSIDNLKLSICLWIYKHSIDHLSIDIQTFNRPSVYRYTNIRPNIYLSIYKHSTEHLSIDIETFDRPSVYRYTNIQSNICLSIYKHPTENLSTDIQTFNRIYVYRYTNIQPKSVYRYTNI